jgi:hypothetical protein
MTVQREPYDGSEAQRYEAALRKCRTCDHAKMTHSNLSKGRCIDAVLTNKEQYKPCTCIDFIPKDNLEYLEWASKKKEKEL